MENVNIMKKLLNVVVVVLCVLMCMPIGASAASNVLMRYEGKNIYDKASISTFELKRVTNIKINHPVGKTTKTFTEEKGTYRLNFTTNMFSANIKGSVTRK